MNFDSLGGDAEVDFTIPDVATSGKMVTQAVTKTINSPLGNSNRHLSTSFTAE